MIALLLARQIAELFLIIFLGFVLVRLKLLKTEDSKVLSTIALYVINPCVIINSFQIEYSENIRNGLILSFAVALVVHVVYIVGVRIAGRAFQLDSVEKASIIYTNAGNLIIPIVLALFGKEWLVYTSGYIVVQTIFMWSHGRMMICEEKHVNIRKILMNINMLASFIGIFMFVFQIHFPDMILDTMESLTNMIGPMCMLVAGMIIAGMDLKKTFGFRRIYLVTFLKMIVFPLIALAMVKFSHIQRLVENGDTVMLISLLACISPTAASITQMTQIYNKNSEYASAIYFLTTLVCIATMPVIVWLYQY